LVTITSVLSDQRLQQIKHMTVYVTGLILTIYTAFKTNRCSPHVRAL